MSVDNNNNNSRAMYILNGFNSRLFERMRAINRTWLEQLRDIRRIESDFWAQLLAASSPAEATSICHEWMAKRLETVASEQQTFTAAWLALVSDTMIAADLLHTGLPDNGTQSRQRSAAT
jgi:hypothetical protein